MPFYKYNPSLMGPETLRGTLVGRELDMRRIRDILKGASSGGSFSHAILIGPQGIGKSHFLQVLYHAMRGEIRLHGLATLKDRFTPVIFAEEEFPRDITAFVGLIIRYLDAASVAAGGGNALNDASLAKDDAREIALDFVRAFKRKTKRILLLLVDNIQDIIERFGEEDQGALRELLMTSESVLLIGAAPLLFDAIVNHEKKLYNFFEIIWLKELTFEESLELLTRYADLERRDDVKEEMKERAEDMRVLHKRIGGNPRIMRELYEIIARRDRPSVEDVLFKLLDEFTPYFRQKLKSLSGQQQAIIDAMARAGEPMTPTEIAAACAMPVNIINAQLMRMQRNGHVEVVKRLRKKVYYGIKEKLFSLWRRMQVEAGRAMSVYS